MNNMPSSIARSFEKPVENLISADIKSLLSAEGVAQQRLFELARKARHEAGQDDVVLRGVIEISNRCQKNCDYCAMRAQNKDMGRYTLSPEDIITLAGKVKESGIKVVFLQGGQNLGTDRILEEVIPAIRKDFGLEVLLCVGEKPKETYEKYLRWGASSYILKYESSDPDLYTRITHGRLEDRLKCLEWIRESGLKFGTGNIVGLPGQTMDVLVNDILLGVRINPDFISTSPFIPNSNTPLQDNPKGNIMLTLNTIAILRLILKKPLIPSVSALESILPEGQTAGLNAGANVITINFTPKENRDLYRIYSAKRFVVSLEHALAAIKAAGLRVRR